MIVDITDVVRWLIFRLDRPGRRSSAVEYWSECVRYFVWVDKSELNE